MSSSTESGGGEGKKLGLIMLYQLNSFCSLVRSKETQNNHCHS